MTEEYMPIDGALEFDGEIDVDSSKKSFPLLKNGTYPFIIEKVERTRVSKEGSKYSGCPMAAVTFRITGETEEGVMEEVTRTENYILHQAFLWKISQLFVSCGMAKDGEKLRMNWPELVTRNGMCEVEQTTYKKKDGTDGHGIQVKKCLPAEKPAWAGGF